MKAQTVSKFAAIGTLLVMGGVAFAQTTPATSPLNQADTLYLMQNAQGSVADQTTAMLGIQMASDNAVQQYAIRVMEDHDRINMQLLMLAHNKGMTLPVLLESKDRVEITSLMQKHGPDFDRSFLQEEVKVNAQDVQDAKQELSTTTDPDVKNFVQEFLNTEQVHLQRAQELLGQTTAPR